MYVSFGIHLTPAGYQILTYFRLLVQSDIDHLEEHYAQQREGIESDFFG